MLAFAREVNAALDALGFPLCTGNVMASNPELCLSMEEWKAKFLGWIREPTPQALLNANIVFDFRPLVGDTALGDALREWLFGYTQANPLFLRLMVQNALAGRAAARPHPHVRRRRRAARVKGTLDLKTRGTRLFVDCARVFALAHGIADTGTAARLRLAGARAARRAAARRGDGRGVPLPAAPAAAPAGLRRRAAAANRIDPYALNEVDQRMLKEAFRQAKQLQERLRLTYRL